MKLPDFHIVRILQFHFFPWREKKKKKKISSFAYLHLAVFSEQCWRGKKINFWHLHRELVDQPDFLNTSVQLCWLLKRTFSSLYQGFWVPNTSKCSVSFHCASALWLRGNPFIRSLIHSQNIALCDIYMSKTNHSVPQLSPISNRKDVLPHPGNRIRQKFMGFMDNKSLAIFQALYKLSNVILCHWAELTGPWFRHVLKHLVDFSI